MKLAVKVVSAEGVLVSLALEDVAKKMTRELKVWGLSRAKEEAARLGKVVLSSQYVGSTLTVKVA